MDLFDEVRVEQEIGPDGSLRLVFTVLETPRLGELRFVTRLSESGSDLPLEPALAKGLNRASGLHAPEPFRDKSLADASVRMTEWLRSQAYPMATIEIELLPAGTESPDAGFIRDVRVRVLQARRETLVSSRIDGWPMTLPAPKSPAQLGDALTAETLNRWKEELLAILWKNAHYRAQVRTESVSGDLVFFVTPGAPFDLKLDLLGEKQKIKARSRFEQEGLSQDAIEETMSAIESDHVKQGYRDVEVDFQEVPNGDRVSGEFVVHLGPKWMVAAVEYQTDGVPSSPQAQGGLTAGAPWIDADIEAEKARLRADLIRQGHVNALVSHEESGEPGRAKVIFKIVPGSMTRIGSVVIEGAPPPKDRSDGSVIELASRAAAVFRNADVARDRTGLLASLRDDGYVDARVDATTEFSDDRTRVAVVFQVTPGPRVRVGRVLVVGLRDTRETVVLRESRLKEGDFLSYQKVLDTQTGLSATGLFTSVQIREVAVQGDERNLIIEVTEGARTTIVPGLGFAETEKVRASVEFTKLNISGRGRKASLFLRGSINGSKALLSLTDPYAFRRRQAVNVQIYVEDDRTRDAFDFHRLGFQAQTVFPVRLGNLLARYTFQETTTSNVAQNCAEVNRDLCDGRISGPSLGLVHDTRNDAIDPRRGTLYSVETLLSLESLGGDSFVKSFLFVARYEELRAGVVLAASARLGLARAFNRSTELPLPERFFAGGASVMRGFETDQVGPGYYNAEGMFVPGGGNGLIATALEARIDVTRKLGVQVFVEAGNVFPEVSDVRLGDLRKVAGVGVRYRSPFGPLRLDWGFKLDRLAGESLHELHFGVGYAF
jgi:outer membrane protein insertion porin family